MQARLRAAADPPEIQTIETSKKYEAWHRMQARKLGFVEPTAPVKKYELFDRMRARVTGSDQAAQEERERQIAETAAATARAEIVQAANVIRDLADNVGQNKTQNALKMKVSYIP
jgi:hypothetical protein